MHGSVFQTHIDAEVRVKQHLELKALFARIVHIQHRLQPILAQRHAVDQPELVRPRLPRIGTEMLVREAEVKFHRVVAAFSQRARLSGRLAQILPGGVAREAVLGELAGSVIFWRRAEALANTQSVSHVLHPLPIDVQVRTGNTTGIPPLTGLLPSSLAALLTHRFSLPLLFQLITVAP